MATLLSPITGNGNVLPIVEVSTYIDYSVLGVATNESRTVPTGVQWCLVTPSTDTYVKRGAAAAVPAADITDGSGSVYIPAGASRLVRVLAGSSLQMISPAASVVQLEWYS